MTNIKIRNNLQVHIINLLGVNDSIPVKLFCDLSILWKQDLNTKELVKRAYEIANLK